MFTSVRFHCVLSTFEYVLSPPLFFYICTAGFRISCQSCTTIFCPQQVITFMEQIFSCYGSNHYDTGEKQAQKHAAGEFKGLFFLLLLFCCWFMIKIILMSVFLVRLPLSPGDFLDLGYHNSDLLRLTPSSQQLCEYNDSNKYPNQIPCKQEYEYKYWKKAYKQK